MNIPSPLSQPPIDGSLLLASPSLQDGIFDQSVIYIHQHSHAKGSEGYILNRPTGELVGTTLCSAEFESLSKLPIHYGGPVATDQLTFSSYRFNGSEGIECQVCISAEEAARTLRSSGAFVRAFIGKSKWTDGQLEDELENHAWYLVPPIQEAFTMPQDETLWKNTLQHLSPFHHIISLTPENPFLN